VSYCVGNIIGPLMFTELDAPRYNLGFKGTLICLAAYTAIAVILRFHLKRENDRRDREYGKPGTEHGLKGLTDMDNKDFRNHL
jgi:hypothetical protein